MVSEFINRNKPLDELRTDKDQDELRTDQDREEPTNGDIAVESSTEPEVADNESCESSQDLQEIEEFLYENEDLGKARPLKKRARMMEIPYATGF